MLRISRDRIQSFMYGILNKEMGFRFPLCLFCPLCMRLFAECDTL